LPASCKKRSRNSANAGSIARFGSRWIGIIAAGLSAITAIFVMPYYPVWSLIYIAIAIMVIYGLSAHYGEQPA
jgi:hypothetical protein